MPVEPGEDMVTNGNFQRRLAAILAADVVGFSAMMEGDEEGTYARIGSLRQDVIEPRLFEHQGRLIKTSGDGFLAEFASPIQALRCAVAIQSTRSDDPNALRLRIGLNLGDVIIEPGGDVFGDGVNIAARLEGLADPGGILISGKIHSEVEGKVDVAFEDRGDQQLKNMSRPVRIFAVRTGQPRDVSEPARPLPLSGKPSIAVLPFQNMSGDPEQEYFADGMVEDIITALARFKSLFVIARNSSFIYKGRAVDIKQVGRELGVRYVLEGSVRKSGSRVRITGQLIEATTGVHLWADRFDGALEDIFDLQDSITMRVVGVIAPRIEKAEIDRSLRKPTSSLDAYDLYLRGLSAFNEWSAEGSLTALQSFSKAVELDPQFATAMALICNCHNQRQIQGWVSDPPKEFMEALRWAKLARETGTDDPFVLIITSWTMAMLAGPDEFSAIVGRTDLALELNPNMAVGWASSGWLRILLGDYDVAHEHLTRALHLNPTDRRSTVALTSMSGVATVHFLQGDYPQAIAWAQKAIDSNPAFLGALRAMAAAQFAAGNLDAARKVAGRLLELNPKESISRIYLARLLRNAPDNAKFSSALRGAGVPD